MYCRIYSLYKSKVSENITKIKVKKNKYNTMWFLCYMQSAYPLKVDCDQLCV